jgi:hypothetical protein
MWRAKKKASGEDDDEPVGLIPNNYIEEVCVPCAGSGCGKARASSGHNPLLAPVYKGHIGCSNLRAVSTY